MLAAESTALSDLLAVGIPVVGPFAGIWLGKRWERGNQDRAWLKDRRLEAYTDLACSVAVVLDHVIRKQGGPPPTTEVGKAPWVHAHNAQEKAKLVGPKELSDKIERLGWAASDLAMMGSDTTMEQYEEKAAEVGALLRDFCSDAADQIQEPGGWRR